MPPIARSEPWLDVSVSTLPSMLNRNCPDKIASIAC